MYAAEKISNEFIRNLLSSIKTSRSTYSIPQYYPLFFHHFRLSYGKGEKGLTEYSSRLRNTRDTRRLMMYTMMLMIFVL